jgi:hypothetical protein
LALLALLVLLALLALLAEHFARSIGSSVVPCRVTRALVVDTGSTATAGPERAIAPGNMHELKKKSSNFPDTGGRERDEPGFFAPAKAGTSPRPSSSRGALLVVLSSPSVLW